MKRTVDPDILFPHDRYGRPPAGWIIETDGSKPFFTEKREVAEKRYKAGSHVTPYHLKMQPSEEDEL